MTHRLVRMSSRCLFLSGLFGLTLSALGCSSDDSNDFAERFCAVFKPCCVKAGMEGDQSFCRALYGSARPTSSALADQCLKEYEALAKEPSFCDFKTKSPESCDKAFPKSSSGGSKKPGASCTSSGECAGDATCDQDFSSDTGLCATFVLAAEGAACIGEKHGSARSWSGNAVDNQILLCDYDAGLHCSGQVCKKRAAVGQACSFSQDCVDAAYCSNDHCAPRLTAGSTCTGTTNDECDSTTYCVESTKTCEPRRADDESCTSDAECLSDNCDSGVCKYNPGLGGLALAFVCG